MLLDNAGLDSKYRGSQSNVFSFAIEELTVTLIPLETLWLEPIEIIELNLPNYYYYLNIFYSNLYHSNLIPSSYPPSGDWRLIRDHLKTIEKKKTEKFLRSITSILDKVHNQRKIYFYLFCSFMISDTTM